MSRGAGPHPGQTHWPEEGTAGHPAPGAPQVDCPRPTRLCGSQADDARPRRVPIVYPRGRTPPARRGPPRPLDLGKSLDRTAPNRSGEPTDQKVGGSSPSERATHNRSVHPGQGPAPFPVGAFVVAGATGCVPHRVPQGGSPRIIGTVVVGLAVVDEPRVEGVGHLAVLRRHQVRVDVRRRADRVRTPSWWMWFAPSSTPAGACPPPSSTAPPHAESWLRRWTKSFCWTFSLGRCGFACS